MRVLLCQLDGKIPNLALMRVAAHHRNAGDEVELRHGADFTRHLWDTAPDNVYASCIFLKTRFLAERLLSMFPAAVEAAEAIGSIDYRDDSMTVKRIYTAWDNLKDEHRLFDGLSRLVKNGVKPDHIMVYMLCGYWTGETQQDREYRRMRLREFGARPYPMPYTRTPELVGFQRWVIGAYDKESNKNHVPWKDFMGANYRPENVRTEPTFPLFEHNTPVASSCEAGQRL